MNFYRKFIPHYSDKARLLIDLTKKDTKFEWGAALQLAFNDLKACFISAPILIIPDKTKPFIVELDASLVATGAILMQQDSNGELHPCTYHSTSFTATERNYNIYNRELLGIV